MLTSLAEDRQADGLCKRTISNGKWHCSACSKKPFDKDLGELVNFGIPDALHVCAFHMPPDSISEQLDCNSFCNDMSLLRPPLGSSQNRQRHVNRKLYGDKSGKRRRIREKSPDSSAEALLKEVLQSAQSGVPLPPELLARMKLSVDGEDRSHDSRPLMVLPRRQDTNFASSGSNFAAPFADARAASNEFQSLHLETTLTGSSSRPGPSTGMGCTINAPSEYEITGTPQSQNARSVSSVPSSRSHGSKTSSTTLLGNAALHRTRHSNSTLYQCTFELCDTTFSSKSDWKRHEESVHKQRYMCMHMECGAGMEDTLRGGYACASFCLEGPFASLEDVKMHTIKCEAAQQAGVSFTRKDKLRTHYRKKHGQEIVDEDDLNWVYDIAIDWPRQCGFCGDPLNDVCVFIQLRQSILDKFLTQDFRRPGVLHKPQGSLGSKDVAHESKTPTTYLFPSTAY